MPCKSKAQIEFTVRKALTRPTSRQRRPAPQSTGAAGKADRVEISPAANAAIAASEGGKVRTDLVNLIRGQIAAGTYDTPEKMDVAMERLLDQIG